MLLSFSYFTYNCSHLLLLFPISFTFHSSFHSPTSSPTHTHLHRFQIEDVHEELSPSVPDASTGASSGGGVAGSSSVTSPQHDNTISSFGYNTFDAVPLTMYYRHGDEEEVRGKARPTLDTLRERSGSNVPGLEQPLPLIRHVYILYTHCILYICM